MCRRLRGAAPRANMDLENNHWRISLDLSLFHPDTLFPQHSAQMEMRARRERRDICLHGTTQCLFCTSACQASHYPYEHMYAHAHTHTHTHTPTNTYAMVPLTFCSVAAAGQVFINRKIHVKGRTAHAESHTRHLSENDKCTAKNLLSRGRLCRLTSCTATAPPANVGILTIFCHSSKCDGVQMSRFALPWT